MRTYWDDRLASIPTQLTLEEASAMSTWVIYLSDSLKEGVAKAIASPAAITQHSRLLRDVTTERISQAPSAIAMLIGHLLRSTQPPFFQRDEIQRIIPELASEPATAAIREQALRLGCTT